MTERARAPVAFTALTLVFFWRIVFTGRFLCWGDVMLQFWPWRHFTRELMLAGRLPLWNPYLFCGIPFAANPQTAVFYPLNLIALPAHAAVTWSVVLHVWLAGVFMILYLRALGRSMFAQLLGACAFAFSGFVITRLQFPNHLVSFAGLPCLLWLYERDREQPGWRLFNATSVVIGLMSLGGHLQVNLIVWSLVGAYVLWDCAARARGGEGPAARRVLTVALGAAGAGVALAAIQLLPTAELLINSSRTEFDSPTARAFALPPWQQMVWLFPDFFGNPARSQYWGEGNFFEATPYVGAATLLLAGAGACWCRHRLRPLLLAVVLVGVLLGMGYYAPFYPAAAKLLLPLKMMRGAGRWLLWPMFAACVFAAHGWDALMAEAAALNRFLRCTIVITAVVFTLGLLPVFFSDSVARTAEPVVALILKRTQIDFEPSELGKLSQAVTVRAGFSIFASLVWIALFAFVLQVGARGRWSLLTRGALAGAVVYADLFWFGASFNPTTTVDAFAATANANTSVDYRIATPQRYLKDAWNDYVSYQQFVFGPRAGGGRAESESQALAAPLRLQLPATNMVTKTRNAAGYDPLRLRSFDRKLRAIEVADDIRAWRELSVRWLPERSARGPDAVRWREIPDWLPRAQLWVGNGGKPQPVALTDSANRVVAECREEGELLIRDVWYPGWRAYANGESVRLDARDGFRRASVRGSRVIFTFQNEALLVGGSISLLALAFVSGCAATRVCRDS